jgi:hypothetical protein
MKRDLKPLALSDEQWEALAGASGFSDEQLAAAMGWGTARLKAYLAARIAP